MLISAARRKVAILSGWLIFAAYAVDAGRNPGFVRNRELVPYPWSGVLLTWLILGAQAFGVFALLRPKEPGAWRARLWPAAGWLGLQAAVGLSMTSTDMPGYYNVPGLFALATFLAVLVAASGHSIQTMLRAQRNRDRAISER